MGGCLNDTDIAKGCGQSGPRQEHVVIVLLLLVVTTRCRVTMIRRQALAHVFALCEQGLLCWCGEEETFARRGRTSRWEQGGSNSVKIVGCAEFVTIFIQSSWY